MAGKNIIDFLFYASNIESMPTKEDAYAYDITDDDHGYISVFDGCGGLGSRRYAAVENRTGAFIAARTAASAVYEWFQRAKGSAGAADIKKALKERLAYVYSKVSDGTRELGGSMVKTLPTTMVIADMHKADKHISGKFLWAGDSRGFILDENGLRQFTKDDISSEEDAYENIINDSPLSNCVYHDGDYKINEQSFSVKAPSFILVATDGAFNYLASPMHFELMLLETMMAANTIAEWEKGVEKVFDEVSGDDATMLMVGCMMDWSFQKLKEHFKKRKVYLETLLKNADDRDKLEQIWKTHYKTFYESKR